MHLSWPTGNEGPVLSNDDPRYVKALGHPLRARILATLKGTEATPTQLAQWLGASVGTTAYHVRTLAGLGLIELVGETRVRGAVAHHYRALAEPEEVAGATSADRPAHGARLSTVDPALCPVPGASFQDDRAVASRVSLRLDSAGWQELSQACAQLLAQAERIARSSGERLAQSPRESNHLVDMVLFVFEASAQDSEASS